MKTYDFNPDYVIYIDGAHEDKTFGSPGACAGIILKSGSFYQKISKAYYSTDVNQMEIMGARISLNLLPNNKNIHIYTDSQLVESVINRFTTIPPGRMWSESGNLLKQEITRMSNVKAFWIKSKSGNEWNTEVHHLARKALLKFIGISKA
jgi:ribonuclease HI